MWRCHKSKLADGAEGKLYNGYNPDNYCNPVCAAGWSKADILLDPSTYQYFNSNYAHFDGVSLAYRESF